MKKVIHPKIYTNTKVDCVCGNKFETISTLPSIHVDICSNCHPLFTGQQKLIDTEGRIDKFNKKIKQTQTKKEEIKTSAKSKTKPAAQVTVSAQETLKDVLKRLKQETEEETTETKQ